jgi:uncharacterized protein (DUF885 family)
MVHQVPIAAEVTMPKLPHLLMFILTVALAGCAGETPPAPTADSVERLDVFLERIQRERRADQPQAMAAALAGTPDEADYLGRLNLPSVNGTEAAQAMARRHFEELAAFEPDQLSATELLSRDILAWTLDQQLRGEAFLWHDYPLNQLMAIHNTLPEFMINQHPLRDERDVDFYLARLAEFPAAFAGTIEVVRHRGERGILPPRFAIEKTLRDARQFIADDAADNPLAREFAARAQRTGVPGSSRLEGLRAELAAAVDAHVYPAYRMLADYLESLLDAQPHSHGVWALPDGDAYYRWLLRGHTTTELGPEEIHDLGLAEVARIEAEMDAILCREGSCEDGVGARMAALNEEPRFLFEDSDAGREAILEAYRAVVAEAAARTDAWFHPGPDIPIEVARVPEFREATAFGAYYMRPALDGSRPGRFFANLRSVDEHPRFGLRTLAYHEAVPGHHLQITRQQGADLPDFRRNLSLHAYSEGWALYAEKLAHEMGLHEDPYDNLGRLQAELFRAVRLVVDTGMHFHRWTREDGIAYMRRITGMPMSDVEAEIERYLVIPGQACAFKIGMLRMEAMRARSEQALGERFDIRDFHAVILDHGPMPLAILDRVVDGWIAEVQSRRE